jgi:hypothetical protein
MDFSGLTDSLGTSPLTAIPLLFVAGLLTSLTPCVYPMIPITVALVGRESLGAGTTRWRPLFLTLSYVFGVALVYAILGVIAGMTGSISTIAKPVAVFSAGERSCWPVCSCSTCSRSGSRPARWSGRAGGRRRSLRRRVAWERVGPSLRRAALQSWRQS